MRFRQISDELVIITDDFDTSVVLPITEAEQLGYKEFTYQGKRISLRHFAQLIGRPEGHVRELCKKYGYSTGEEVIEHYEKFEAAHKKIGHDNFTYQGKNIFVSDFARLIGETYAKIYKIAYKTGYMTGEEIIQFLREQEKTKRVFTYKGEKITVNDFARLIGKNEGTIDDIVRRNNYKTGEEVLQYLQTRPEKKTFTYQGKEITRAEFARLINKSEKSVVYIVSRYNLNTGEELIAFYKKKQRTRICDIFTYQGKHITYRAFGEIINKSVIFIQNAIRNKGFTTGEEIIDYITEQDSRRLRFTFNGQPISQRQFSKQTGISTETVRRCYNKYNCRTGEEVIERLRQEGKL